MEGLSRTAPAYLRIAASLREEITSGALQPDDRLPSEYELAETWGVARQTVRNGLALLVSEGLVVTRRPHGHFVRKRETMTYQPQMESRDQPVSAEMDRFIQQITEEGRTPSQHIDVSLVHAATDVATRLQVEPGTLVVARRRVRFINGEPVNLNDTYHPLDMVKDSEIMSPADVPRGTNQVLADLGYPQVRAIDEIFVRMPTTEQIQRLGLGPGAHPVAVHYVTGYVEDGRPVRCTINVLPGDQHVILYEREFERKWK